MLLNSDLKYRSRHFHNQPPSTNALFDLGELYLNIDFVSGSRTVFHVKHDLRKTNNLI